MAMQTIQVQMTISFGDEAAKLDFFSDS